MSEDERDKRLRSSILVEQDELVVVIDTGPDFRQQMLRAGVLNWMRFFIPMSTGTTLPDWMIFVPLISSRKAPWMYLRKSG